MRRHRKRTVHDADYRVFLSDKEGVIIAFPGTFFGRSPSEAIDLALKMYPGVMANMQTKQWTPYAEYASVVEKILQPSD
jgi:hypothetical protein